MKDKTKPRMVRNALQHRLEALADTSIREVVFEEGDYSSLQALRVRASIIGRRSDIPLTCSADRSTGRVTVRRANDSCMDAVPSSLLAPANLCANPLELMDLVDLSKLTDRLSNDFNIAPITLNTKLVSCFQNYKFTMSAISDSTYNLWATLLCYMVARNPEKLVCHEEVTPYDVLAALLPSLGWVSTTEEFITNARK